MCKIYSVTHGWPAVVPSSIKYLMKRDTIVRKQSKSDLLLFVTLTTFTVVLYLFEADRNSNHKVNTIQYIPESNAQVQHYRKEV